MKFAILTTTHKRPAELQRAVDSVRSQSFTDYVHYIVNDSPDHDYAEVEKDITGDRAIVYTKNTENIGKNSSLNIILEKLRQDNFNGYVVFLDDDDWLAPACLFDFKSAIEQNPKKSWFVSNRYLEGGASLTKNNTGRVNISYFTEYLLLKKFSGDTTHCISFAKAKMAHYPVNIKNGEEWYYFLSISKYCKEFLHLDTPGTYTKGYDPAGQNATMQINYKLNTLALFREEQSVLSFTYLVLRTLKNYV